MNLKPLVGVWKLKPAHHGKLCITTEGKGFSFQVQGHEIRLKNFQQIEANKFKCEFTDLNLEYGNMGEFLSFFFNFIYRYITIPVYIS